MDGLDYWRLCDELSVVQAALLVVNVDPSTETTMVEKYDYDDRPVGYEAAKHAIVRALLRNDIEGTVVPDFRDNLKGGSTKSVDGRIDIWNSQVSVRSLKVWLSDRGISTGFFFPSGAPSLDYLDPLDPRYAPKLAAAVLAWLETRDQKKIQGKSPKQALIKWLREHASEFSLTDDDGKPNETGIEEVAKVANWKPTGGAPKTPNS